MSGDTWTPALTGRVMAPCDTGARLPAGWWWVAAPFWGCYFEDSGVLQKTKKVLVTYRKWPATKNSLALVVWCATRQESVCRLHPPTVTHRCSDRSGSSTSGMGMRRRKMRDGRPSPRMHRPQPTRGVCEVRVSWQGKVTLRDSQLPRQLRCCLGLQGQSLATLMLPCNQPGPIPVTGPRVLDDQVGCHRLSHSHTRIRPSQGC